MTKPMTPFEMSQMADAAEAAIEALEHFALIVRNAGGDRADEAEIRQFAVYALAECEGTRGNAGWLGGPFLLDRLYSIRDGISEALADEPDTSEPETGDTWGEAMGVDEGPGFYAPADEPTIPYSRIDGL